MGRHKHVRVLAMTKQRSKRKASMEIAKYQKSTKLLIPFQPFSRLVKEILQECNERLYIEKRAILALQDEEIRVLGQFIPNIANLMLSFIANTYSQLLNLVNFFVARNGYIEQFIGLKLDVKLFQKQIEVPPMQRDSQLHRPISCSSDGSLNSSPAS
ncbi:core histone h2A/H2B/H3/H4 domain-containing protein [Ditylenchus destructor]|nr:core histone h2A/H2B/H3/H4 domain-containing protein [Ditylenchus destructor]